jgi:RND superfamily putative drug exporter
VEVLIGGSAAVRNDLNTTARGDIARADAIGIPLTALALMIVFRSFIAAFLPLIVGVVAMIGTNASLEIAGQLTDVSVFSINLATGLSLRLATDYALFIVARYRERLASGADPAAAVQAALTTAGRTVVLSALTVAVTVTVAAMVIFPLYFLRSFAYAGVSVALLAAFAAMVSLPARWCYSATA